MSLPLFFFRKRSRRRTVCEFISQINLRILANTSFSFVLSAKTAEKVSTIGRHSEILELKKVISKTVSELRDAQRLLMPALGPLLDGIRDTEASGDVPKLILPSDLSARDREACCPSDIITLEAHFRCAQAHDSLAELRRLRRLLQGLQDQNSKHLSQTQRTVTRTRGLFEGFRAKIRRVASRYSRAYKALLVLDPDQKVIDRWMERFQKLNESDIRGPGHDHDNISEGKFTPSWIWLVPHSAHPSLPTTSANGHATAATPSNESIPEDDEALTDSMRVYWARCQARADRYEEEVMLAIEEMGRTLHYFEWKRSWWLSVVSEREKSGSPPTADLQRGLEAYAHRQAKVYEDLMISFALRWRETLFTHGRHPAWFSSNFISKLPPLEESHNPSGRLKSTPTNNEPPLPPPAYDPNDKDCDGSEDENENTNGSDDREDDDEDDDCDHHYQEDDGEYIIDDLEAFDIDDELIA